MTYQPLNLLPGVILDDTQLAAGGYAIDSDKVVFWMGRPQSMGGWRTVKQGLLGTARAILEFATLDGTPQAAIGTTRKLYVWRSNNLFDITPERTSGALPAANPLATTAGSNVVTVTHTGHGAVTGDIVYLGGFPAVGGIQIGGGSGTLPANSMTSSLQSNRVSVIHADHGLNNNDIAFFTGATAFGGIPATDINAAGGLRVQVVNDDIYYIYPPTRATSGASGGGSPTFVYAKPYEVTVVDGAHYTVVGPNNATSTVAAGGGSGGKFSFDISAGRSDAGLSSGGFGTGRFGAGLFGRGESTVTSPTVARLWSLDKFGEDLIANICGSTIYRWISAAPGARATVLANAPARANWIAVSPQRIIIAFGCTDTNNVFDPLIIRHTSPELATDWIPSLINTARVERADEGSRLISALSTSRGIVFWSDSAFYELRFVGAYDQVFKPEVIGRGSGIIGPNAAAEVGGIVYWFDPNLQLGTYDGGRSAPQMFPMHTYLLQSVNLGQANKIFCLPDRNYAAVQWLLPQYLPNDPSGVECNGYVRFDVNEARGDPMAGWSRGTFDRTAWSDRRTFQFPLAVDTGGNLYEHNNDMAADGQPIYRYLEYAFFELDAGGNQELKVSRFIPDTQRTEAMQVTMRAKEYPEEPEQIVEGPLILQPFVPFKDFELRARQLSLKLEFTTKSFWRIGKPKLDISGIGPRGL